MAPRAGHRCAECERRIGADEIDRHVDAPASGQIADACRPCARPWSRPSSAPRSTAPSRASARSSTAMIVAGERARRICTAMCPSPPRPMTTAVEPGHQQRQRALDRVIRREGRVGQRRGQRRFEVSDRHDPATLWDEHVRGHPAVESEAAPEHAELGLSLAVVLGPDTAPRAHPASPRPVHGDGLTDLEPGHTRTDGLDPARVLVAEREGWIERHRPRREVVHEMEVRVTCPGALRCERAPGRVQGRVGPPPGARRRGSTG